MFFEVRKGAGGGKSQADAYQGTDKRNTMLNTESGVTPKLSSVRSVPAASKLASAAMMRRSSSWIRLGSNRKRCNEATFCRFHDQRRTACRQGYPT